MGHNTAVRIGFIVALLLMFTLTAATVTVAAPRYAPPVDFYQIDNGGSAFIDPNNDTDSDSISGAPPAGICTLRDAIETYNTAPTTLGAQGNGCTLSNPSGTLPATRIYVINLPAYTYTLNNPPLSNDRLNIFNPNDDELFLVGATPATTIVQAGAGAPFMAGAADNRVFDINGGTVEFSNMTIRHGFCQNFCANAFTVGGGIWNNRKIVTLDNVVVTDNFADTRGGGIYNEAGGTLNIINGSVITNNTVGRPAFSFGDGGGIYINGNNFNPSFVTIDNSTVSNNTVTDDGGGIFNGGDSTLIVQNGSLIDGNVADENNATGGGIYNTQGTVTVDGSTISNNLAIGGGTSNDGGGIYNTFGGIVNIVNGTVIGGAGNGNIADDGSGIYNNGFVDGQVIIDNSTVSFNGVDVAMQRSRDGGGIFNQGIVTIQNNVSISNNVVEQFNGGGIVNEIGQGGSGIMTITDSMVNNNSTGLASFVGGGGIYNRLGGTINITNSSVDGNTGRIGAGITNSGAGTTMTIDSTTVSGNTATTGAAGGIHNLSGAVITIQNNSVVGGATPNTSAFLGGGIYNHDPDSLVIITDSAVDNNTAAFQGGGIYNGGTSDGGEVQITNSSVDGNTANGALPGAGGGGGIFNDGIDSLVTITNSTVNGNTAPGANGGGIHNEDNGTVIIENGSSVSNNSAGSNGGGISNAGGFAPTRPTVTTLTITDSSVMNNTSGGTGGAISNDGPFDVTANVTITNSIIGSVAQPNSAVEGGAIFNDSASNVGFGNVTITDGIVEGNIATGVNGGGAFSNFADFDGISTITINNSTVMNHQATGGPGGAFRNFSSSGGNSNIIIQNGSTIQGNTAAQQGGGFYNDANFEFGDDGISTIIIDDAIIGGNTAGTDGGAVYNTFTDPQATSTTTITDSQLLVNAAANGGGIFHDDGTTTITDSCLVGNGEGYRNNTTTTQIARRNWWGTFDGPSDADGLSGATGSGDGVTQFVNFNNFETTPILNCPLANIPYYTSVPPPGSTIILNTRPNQLIASSIVVTNLGGVQLDLTAIGLGGAVPELTLLTAAPINLASTASGNIDFECLSASTGTFIDTLAVDHNANGTPASYTIECRVRQNAVVGVEVEEAEAAAISVFDPAISKIGFLLPGQLGVTGEQVEWVVTVSNTGSAPGNNIVVTDTLRDELRIDSVSPLSPPNAGESTDINGQTVTVTIPVINPGEIFTFSIFTTVLESPNDGLISNEACINGGGAAKECTIAHSPVGQLPATGETPFWRWPLLFMLAAIAGAVGILGGVEVRGRRRHI